MHRYLVDVLHGCAVGRPARRVGNASVVWLAWAMVLLAATFALALIAQEELRRALS